jgi:FAD/FMN-containing dehydrogenase/ferredoxin
MTPGSYLESRFGIEGEKFLELTPAQRTARIRERIPDLHGFVDDGRSLEERELPARTRALAVAIRDAVRRAHERLGGTGGDPARPSEAAATLESRILTDTFLRGEYSKDQNVYLAEFFTRTITAATPDVVFQPVSPEEVSAVLRWARDANVPVTLRGAGSSAMGGAVPADGGVVLDLTRLDEVTVDRSDGVAVLGAGARFRIAHATLAREDRALRVYPSNLGGTFAGWLAAGGIGLNAFSPGRARDVVRWIEFVLPDGEIVRVERGGTTTTKISLDDIAGTEGQFGVITRIAVETQPRAEHACFLLAFDGEAQAFAFVDWARRWSGQAFPNPANFKWLSASHLHHARKAWADDDARAWREHPGRLASAEEMPWTRLVGPRALGAAAVAGERDGNAGAYVFLDFHGEAAGRAFAASLPKAPGSPRALDADSVRFGAERFRPQSVKRLGPGLLAAEILMPAERVPDFLRAAQRLSKGAQVELDAEVYYLADGVALILAAYLVDHRKGSVIVDLALTPALTDLAMRRFGGRPYVLGRWQSAFFARAHGSARARSLREAKRRLDPRWTVNRGSFFSGGFRGPLGSLLAAGFAPSIGIARLLFGSPIGAPFVRLARGIFSAQPGPLSGRAATAHQTPVRADGTFDLASAARRAGTCVNCGECNSVCPIFRDSGVRLPQMLTHLGEKVAAGGEPGATGSVLLDLCMRCGNCEEVCQAGIPHLPMYELMQQASDRARPRNRDRHIAILAALRAAPQYARRFLDIRPGGYLKRTPASLPGLLRFVLQRAENDAGAAATCIHCGACVAVCPTSANLEYQESDPRLITTNQSRCIGCGTCVEICPANHANGGQTLRVMEAPTLEWIRLAREEMAVDVREEVTS